MKEMALHTAPVKGTGGDKMFRPILNKTTKLSNKVNVIASFLSSCDQCTLYTKTKKV